VRKLLVCWASPWAEQAVDLGIRKALRGAFLKGRFLSEEENRERPRSCDRSPF